MIFVTAVAINCEFDRPDRIKDGKYKHSKI